MNIKQELKKAVLYHRSGKLEQAENIYTQILAKHPEHADALHLMGLLAYEKGKNNEGINLIKKAIETDHSQPFFFNNLGNIYKAVGRFDDARSCYSSALTLTPEYADACYNMANILRELKNPDEAISYYKKTVKIIPEHIEAYNNMAVLLCEQGKAESALLIYKKILEIKPYFYNALNNMGHIYKDQKNFDDAMSCYKKSIKADPGRPEAYASMGSMLQITGRLNEAVKYYKKAINIKPDFYEAFNDMGTVFLELNMLQPAMECFIKAATINPFTPNVYNNIGNVYKKKGRFNKAAKCYEKGIDLNPDLFETYYNLGLVYGKTGRFEEAVGCYKKAIEKKSDYTFAYNFLIYQLQQICSWKEINPLILKLDKLTKKTLKDKETSAQMPFLAFSLNDDPLHNFNVAKSWSDNIENSMGSLIKSVKGSKFLFSPGLSRKKRIILGYLSSDFKNHATAHLMLSMFKMHNRDKFKIYCYSDGEDDKSSYRTKIINDCDGFVEIRGLSHFDAATRIYNDQVDILIDLKGYTEGGRLEIFALRPSPVQVSYLGFPGTTGADFIDYIIADKIVIPLKDRENFSEKVVYMPNTYQVNDRFQIISDQNISRKEAGLPENGFVFCSFNGTCKIDSATFDLWLSILRDVPKSVLWLLKSNDLVEYNLKYEAEKRDVDSDRLFFGEKLLKDRHLARLKLADLAIDTIIVNGHTTTSDALWAGVPVITLQGRHFASRVSSSILNAIGLNDLIVHNTDDYRNLAILLAKDPARLKFYRQKIDDNRMKYPLFDTLRFVKNIEKAYQQMWKIYESGNVPVHINVTNFNN